MMMKIWTVTFLTNGISQARHKNTNIKGKIDKFNCNKMKEVLCSSRDTLAKRKDTLQTVDICIIFWGW